MVFGITLAMKHKDKRDPKDWKGMKFAIPFDYSMHNYLLRYYLAEHGLDPDTDVQLRSVPPPEMVANLRTLPARIALDRSEKCNGGANPSLSAT
jgi:ABC-type nitrate/sulfonate/bicarbonate transport system substrate-binding protein